MKILVTGATGFIGRHLIPRLLERGHAVTAVARSLARAEAFPWFAQVEFVALDIHESVADPASILGVPDTVIHLAWPDLTEYQSLTHIERSLPADFRFLDSLVRAGVGHLVIAGTCFEYGMQNGCLDEGMVASPVTSYAVAKDSLRKFLQLLQRSQPFRLCWTRIFYPYGDGQKSNSLLAQLHSAIERGESAFPMSGGEQLRDYLPVTQVASHLAMLAEIPSFDGIVNICSGRPISVRRFVEEYLARRNATIRLDLGHYPYPRHEPMAFWGSIDKLSRLLDGAPCG